MSYVYARRRLLLVSTMIGFISALPYQTRIPAKPSIESTETTRDLCLQAIQQAIIGRTADIFQSVYRPDEHQRPFLLYQMAEHGNMGDTFIDRGEELLLARHGLEPAVECTSKQDKAIQMDYCEQEWIEEILHEDATVLFQGGGNWGDLWAWIHQTRMNALNRMSTYRNLTLVTLPTSLKFYDDVARKASEQEVRQMMERKAPTTRIIFLFRQRNSFVAAKAMYPGVDVRLVPDMAFMIGPLLRVDMDKFKYDILFLHRTDKEGDTKSEGVDIIHSKMAEIAPDLSYYVGDWSDNPTSHTLLYKHLQAEITTPAMRHSAVVDAAVRYFSTAKVIVSDRLHASILALLMNTPHVIIDPGANSTSYGKRIATRASAFETSVYCTQETLRYRDATTIEDGVKKGVELHYQFFQGRK